MKLLIIITSIILASCKGGSSSSSESSRLSNNDIAVNSEHMISDGIYTLGCFNNEYFLTALAENHVIEFEVNGTNFEVRVKHYGNMACTNLIGEYTYKGTLKYEVEVNDEAPSGYDVKVEYLVNETWVKDLTMMANRFNACGGNYTDHDWHEITNAGCEQDQSNKSGNIWKLTHYDNGDFDTKGLHSAYAEDFEFTKQ